MVNTYVSYDGLVTASRRGEFCGFQIWLAAPFGRTGDTELLGATLPLCRARVSPAKPSGRWSSPDLAKGHLRHVDCTAAEAAFAIHQIVAPELMKLVTETIQRASGHGC